VHTRRVAVLGQPFAIAQDGLTENAGNLGLRTIVPCHSFFSFTLFCNGALISKSVKNQSGTLS